MDIYRKILLLLKDLLHKSDNAHWEQWIDRDIYEWDNSKATSHHKSAFGGMGSINDLAVCRTGSVGTWQNHMFDLLKSMSWTFAAKGKIRYPVAQITSIEGFTCSNCFYAAITETEIERYISTQYLPIIIANLLQTDKYFDLTNFEVLINRTEVAAERKKLLTALTASNIHLLATTHMLNTCPSCNSINTCVYSWNIVTNDNKVILTESKNNWAFKINTSWWRRLIGNS